MVLLLGMEMICLLLIQYSQNYSSHCNFPYSYGGIRNRILRGGHCNFKVQEIEVFIIEFVD